MLSEAKHDSEGLSMTESNFSASCYGGSFMRPVVFILIGVAALSALTVFGSSAFEPVELTRVGSTIEVTVGGKPFTTYHFESEVAKPYFQPLRGADGTVITRGFPLGNVIPPERIKDQALEPHQRPMYFGHGNIDGIDFWGEGAFPKWSDDAVFGRTVLRKIEAMESGPNSGRLAATFELVSPRGRAIAEEAQSFVIRGDPTTRTIDCEFTITANQGSDVAIGDTKEG